jgi:hypothetical protein
MFNSNSQEACTLIAAQTVTVTSIMFVYFNWLETLMHPAYFDI